MLTKTAQLARLANVLAEDVGLSIYPSYKEISISSTTTPHHLLMRKRT